MTPELSAALKAISRLLDASPDPETIYGAQILLETLAASPAATEAS